MKLAGRFCGCLNGTYKGGFALASKRGAHSPASPGDMSTQLPHGSDMARVGGLAGECAAVAGNGHQIDLVLLKVPYFYYFYINVQVLR